MESNICPVCGNNAQVHSASSFFGEVVKCGKCGIFYIEHDIIENGEIEPKIIASMYYYLIHNIIKHKPKENEKQKIFPHFIKYGKSADRLLNNHFFITAEDLDNIFPKTYNDKIEKILLNLVYLSNGMDGNFTINFDKAELFQAIFFIDNFENYNIKLINIIDNLIDMNLIKSSRRVSNGINYKITGIGWERIETIRNKDFESEIKDNIGKIEETKNAIKLISKQAFEHLEQAKKQLENSDNERARKDAVRDCASAMESMIKNYGNADDIKEASKQLRLMKTWGKDEIVKDGDAIFNTLHRLYPDLRHGSIETSQMTLEEALYWVDRITAYINYMVRKNDVINS